MENNELKEKLIYINRITKVVKGGRRFAFSALVVAGNQAGKLGVAHAKAKQVSDAIKKATEVAKRKKIKLNEKEEIFNPELNTQLGTLYLGRLSNQFKSELIYTAGGYNAGPHNMIKWINRWRGKSLDVFVEQIPFKETRNYVKRVYRSYKFYKQIYSS